MAAPAIASSTNISASGTGFAVTNPSGMTAGELFLAIISKDDDPGMSSDNGMSTGYSITQATGNALWCFWKIALATDISRGDMNFTGDNEAYVGRMYRITGFYSASPIDAVEATGAIGTSNTPQAPTLETQTDDTLVFAATGMDDNDTPYAVITGTYTEDHNADNTTSGIVIARRVMSTAGFTGVCDFTTNASDGWAATQIAIGSLAPPVVGAGALSQQINPFGVNKYGGIIG